MCLYADRVDSGFGHDSGLVANVFEGLIVVWWECIAEVWAVS